MAPPEARLHIGTCDLRILGTIAGFVPDGERVRAAFEEHRPDLVGLGVPPEDLPALEQLRTSEGAKAELVEPDLASERFLKLLGRFGATRIPSPDLEVAYSLARAAQTPIAALDLDDPEHSAAYVQRVKVRHLWWHPRKERRLLARGFAEVQDPYELAALWDGEVNSPKPLRQVEELREAQMAARLRAATQSAQRILALVPAPRLPGVARRLQSL